MATANQTSILLLIISFGSLISADDGSKNLNVFVVLADAWRYSAFSGAEDPDALAHTPILDAFRRESYDFSRCYAAYPLCTPSRISIQSGLYTSRHNVTKNGGPLAVGTRTMATTFSALGYDTAFFGKWHVGGDGYGSANAMKLVSAPHRHGFQHWEQGVSQAGTGYGDYRHPVLLTPEKNEQGATGTWEPVFYTDRALAWLKSASRTQKPFFGVLSWRPPHGPWGFESKSAHKVVMEKYTGLIQSADNKKLRPNMALRKWLNPQNSDGLLSMMTGYYAAIIELDMEFGRVLDTLKKSNGANTIVAFASDHGEMLQSHEMIGKGTWYDEAARVPLLIRLPSTSTMAVDEAPKGRVYRAASSLTDLYPTLIGLAIAKNKPTTQQIQYNEKTNEIMTMENNRVDGKDLSIQLQRCQHQEVKLSNIDCAPNEEDRERRSLRVSKAKAKVLSSYTSRIVFSGMKGFWRMATNGHQKVVVSGKLCDPCGDRLFYDLVADPFEMRPRKYSDATSSGNAWYDEGVRELEETLFFWCRTNSVYYDDNALFLGGSVDNIKRLGFCKSNPASLPMYEPPHKRHHNKTSDHISTSSTDLSPDSRSGGHLVHKEVATVRNTKKLRDKVSVIFESSSNSEKTVKVDAKATGGKSPWWKTQLEKQKKAKAIS